MKKQGMIPYKGKLPDSDSSVFIAEGAKVIGDVTIGRGGSIWFNAVLRGDVHSIRIGEYTNIQDGAVVHVQTDTHPAVIGSHVTVGHGVILHGCTVADNCLIGMGAILLNGADIGENSIVGAGALVTEGKKFPPGSLIVGSPAKVIRTLSEADFEAIRQSAVHYYELSREYMTE